VGRAGGREGEGEEGGGGGGGGGGRRGELSASEWLRRPWREALLAQQHNTVLASYRLGFKGEEFSHI